jgi:hypothetical protein
MIEQANSVVSARVAEAVPPPDPHDGLAPETRLTQEREKKILEFQADALHMDSPLAANVALMTGDLMLYACHVRRVLEPALKAVAQPQDFPQVTPAIDGYLRLARQVERLSYFLDRLQREHKASATAAASLGEVNGG